MAHDITKDVIGCKEFEGQNINLSGADLKFNCDIILGNMTSGSVPFIDSNLKLAQDNFNFFWDDANNRLGLGTAIPKFRLHLVGASNATTTFAIGNSTYDATSIGSAVLIGQVGVTGDTPSTFQAVQQGGGAFNDLILQPSGRNVGIGTTDPEGFNLYVKAIGDNNSVIMVDSGAARDSTFRFRNGGTSKWMFGNAGTSADEFIISQGTAFGTNDFFTILQGGNVGIGTTGPVKPLHVVKSAAGATIRCERITSNVSKVDLTAGSNVGEVGTASNDPFVLKVNGTEYHRIGTDGTARLGSADANSVQVDSTGNMVFVGGGGLAFAEIYARDNTTTTSTSTTKTQILIFDTNGESNNMTPDHTNDHITVVKAGKYKIDASISIKNSSGSAHVISLEMYKNNGTGVFNNIHAGRTLGTGTDVGNLTMSGIVDLAVNDTIEFWITSDSGAARTVTVEDIDFCAIQIGGT